MNLQSLVVVVLRLMALDFLLQIAIKLTPQILQFATMYSPEYSPSLSKLALPLLVTAGFLVGAVLIWVLALPIARLVTRRIPQEISFGAMSLMDCYSIAFMGVGLFYAFSNFPLVLNWSHFLLKAAATGGDSWKEGLNGYDISQAFIPFILGIVLFVNGRRWAEKLARRHAANLDDVKK